ncbi:hypothetical protein F5Y17DRAFT_259957 [Xylariaceae sp. FL0594]|nr:hypothetical protein F5Y17DRAFT_259957 [Xylariaceae sp. FL0594]
MLLSVLFWSISVSFPLCAFLGLGGLETPTGDSLHLGHMHALFVIVHECRSENAPTFQFPPDTPNLRYSLSPIEILILTLSVGRHHWDSTRQKDAQAKAQGGKNTRKTPALSFLHSTSRFSPRSESTNTRYLCVQTPLWTSKGQLHDDHSPSRDGDSSPRQKMRMWLACLHLMITNSMEE